MKRRVRPARGAAEPHAKRGLSEWWFSPAPAERLAALRICIGTFALCWVMGRMQEMYRVAQLPRISWRPTGLTAWLDKTGVLHGPYAPTTIYVISIATAILLAAFTLGLWHRVLAPLAAIGLLFTLTYRNSWGMIFHTENLLVLHVLVLAFTPSADAYALRRQRRDRAAGYGWVIKLLIAITVLTYVMAAIAKLRIAGMAWLDGEQLRNQIAVDNLRKALLGDSIAPLATPFLDHPSGFTIFSVMTIVLELGSIAALTHRWIGRGWAVAAWSFHVGVVLLMNIWFPYPLLGLAYLPLFPAERPVQWAVQQVRRRLRPAAGIPDS